jgi:hypothetical protein
LIKALRVANFGVLYLILLCNSYFMITHMTSEKKVLIGDMRVESIFDVIRIILLFLLQALLSYYDYNIGLYKV